MLVEIDDERLCLVGGTELLLGIAPGGEIVPARTARGLRVRRDDLDALLDQIVPVLDALWISFSHQEDDGGSVGRGVQRQALLPVGAGETLCRNRVNVI